MIHQLNEALWTVEGNANGRASQETPELHISYHNGDHYNSVRYIGEQPNVKIPAKVKIKTKPEVNGVGHHNGVHNQEENGGDYDDDDVRKVMDESGIEDHALALQALELNANCVQAAVDYLLQSQISGQGKS